MEKQFMNVNKNSYIANLCHRIENRVAAVGVIGVGYVGLPVATAFSKHFDVVGFDVDTERVSRLQQEYHDAEPGLQFSGDENLLDGVSFYIITVPTPVDEAENPDLSFLQNAVRIVGRHLKPGDFVVFESSVYPGCTESTCIPLLENISGLTNDVDFFTGYSPERINPADMCHGFVNTAKIIASCNPAALECMHRIYQTVIEAEVHSVNNIKVAEAAKMMENAQRNVNIALMNELSQLYATLGIEMSDVLDAAATKWNFVPYNPGLVGGHCIPVDPFYLIGTGISSGLEMPLLKASCAVNNGMAGYVAASLLKRLRDKHGCEPHKVNALLMGFTYKENIDDIRNTMSAELFRNLADAGVDIDVVDCMADADTVMRSYGIPMAYGIPHDKGYDLVIVAVAHDEYTKLDEKFFCKIMRKDGLLADLKWIYKGRIHELDYWSL